MTNLINTSRYDGNGNISNVWKLYDSLPTKIQNAIDIAKTAIIENRLIALRKEQIEISEIDGVGFQEIAMGSGGVGQLKIVKNQVRFQIGYGHSKHNFATCLVIEL
jgi:hypothetical protein